MPQSVSRYVERFQMIKAQEKAKAIELKKTREAVAAEVKKHHSQASKEMIEAIVTAHLKAKALVKNINGRKVEVVRA